MATIEFNSIENGSPVFITDLKSLLISGIFKEFHLDLQEVISPGAHSPVFETDYYPPLSGNSHLSGLADLIESRLIGNKTQEREFEITVHTTDNRILTKTFHAVRSGNDIEDAADILPLMFLTDSDMISVPYENPEDIFEPTISIYDKTPVKLYVMTDAGSIPVAPQSAGNIHTYTLPIRQLLKSNPPEPGGRKRWTAAAGNRSIVIQVEPFTGGVGFLFENTFGVREYIYLKGVWSEAPEKSHTVAIIRGRRQSVNPVVTPKYTLTCQGLTFWQAAAASRLLQSRHVEICRDCIPKPYGSNLEMIIESVSGNIQDNPATLSDIKITMTPTKI